MVPVWGEGTAMFGNSVEQSEECPREPSCEGILGVRGLLLSGSPGWLVKRLVPEKSPDSSG